jgi:hypothetical protein
MAKDELNRGSARRGTPAADTRSGPQQARGGKRALMKINSQLPGNTG